MNSAELQQRYTSGDRNFQNLDLSGVDLSGLDLRKTDFRGADCYGTKFMDSLLNEANFSGTTNLAYADFCRADLSEANLCGANLDGANLEGAIAQHSIYNNHTKFPLGFDPIEAGAIHAEDLEQQTRLTQIAALKKQPLPSDPIPTKTTIPNPSVSPSVIEPSAPEIEPLPPISIPLEPLVAATTPTSAPSAEPISTTLYELHPSKSSPSSNSCLGLLVGMAVLAGLGFVLIKASTLLKSGQSANNPFANRSYPLPACGDPLPNDPKAYPLRMYPVFVRNPAQNLAKVKSQLCRDAYETKRKDQGDRVVQVASFLTQARAQQFAQFMTQTVGSGEVGTSTLIN